MLAYAVMLEYSDQRNFSLTSISYNAAQALVATDAAALQLQPNTASAIVSGVAALLAHEGAPLSTRNQAEPDVVKGVMAPLSPAWVGAPPGDPAAKVPCHDQSCRGLHLLQWHAHLTLLNC
jgi:hypothetical protein